MSIEIGFIDGQPYFSGGVDSKSDSVLLTERERLAMEIVAKALEGIGVSDTDYCCKRLSQNYLSVVTHCMYDFMRIKAGVNSTWFSVYLSKDFRQKLETDTRFDAQKNKKELHWKVKLESIDQLSLNHDLILAAYQSALWSYQIDKLK